MRAVLFLIGVLGVVWFATPLFVGGILNIGNATGIVIFICVALYGIARQRINQIMTKIWGTNWGKAVCGAAGVILFAVVTLAICATISMYQATCRRPSLKSTVVAVSYLLS